MNDFHGKVMVAAGKLAVVAALILMASTYYPILVQEGQYYLRKASTPPTAQYAAPRQNTMNQDFGIAIPKLGIQAAVIPNVNPFDSREYQLALTKGVAHASGSAFPDEGGNIFLFAHSSANSLTANQYNSVFYLLHHLQARDEVILYYHSTPYYYQVTEKKIVDSEEIEYLLATHGYEELTLMTCWPPGTSLKRLLVIAQATNRF